MARGGYHANAAGSGGSAGNGGSGNSGIRAEAAAQSKAQVARKPAQCHARANARRLLLMAYLFDFFTRYDR